METKNIKLIAAILGGWIMSYISLSILLGPFDGDDVVYGIGLTFVPGIIVGAIIYHVMLKEKESQKENIITLESRLKELKNLLDQGILTKEEFEEQKRKLLNEN